jgi:dTMP kinase
MTKGKFITVEGVEGTGKSTNIELIASLVGQSGYEVLLTREPGGTALGEKVRHLLLDRNEEQMSAMAELLLMFAARAQHVEEVIRPALDNGVWVISDRFTDSSYAYQGAGRGLGAEQVSDIERLVLKGFRPDLTILLDLDVEQGLARAASVGTADRFEAESATFFKKVREAFLSRAAETGAVVVDAGVGIDEVQAEITAIISEFLNA